jgi:hypothetical protein
MTCQEVQHILQTIPHEQWPQEVHEHLKSCIECSLFSQLSDFPRELSHLDLFPSIDLSPQLMTKIHRHQHKKFRMQVISLAASIVIGFFIGLLLQYLLQHNSSNYQEPPSIEISYQFSDMIYSNLYDINNNNNDHE